MTQLPLAIELRACFEHDQATFSYSTLEAAIAAQSARPGAGQIFWSLYVADETPGWSCIGDYKTREAALEVYAQLERVILEHHSDAPHTACCIWEEFLERKGSDSQDQWHLDFRASWENTGSASMRQNAVSLARHAEQLWDGMSEDEQELFAPFDWEFIPWFVRQLDPTGGYVSRRTPPGLEDLLREELVVRRGRHAVLHGRS